MKSFLKALCAVALFSAHAATAKDFTEQDVPAPLKPWVGWVLADYEKNPCPFLYNSIDERSCSWPGELNLAIEAKQARFTLQVTVYEKKSIIPLPGNSDFWPQTVTINNMPAVVITHAGNKPAVQLDAGNYSISGSFQWDEMPEMLPIPPATGLLNLTVNGTQHHQPEIDSNNQLWLGRKAEKQQGEADRLDIKLYRKFTDAIPLTSDARLTLHVAGKPREAVIGKLVLPGFIPMAVDSPLPARLEPDGTLRMQLRPGTWHVNVRTRHDTPLAELTLPENLQITQDEVWSVELINDLRMVQIEPKEKAQTIDPSQTEMPDEWKSLPAFHVTAGGGLGLKETRRGESDPAPDEFDLRRTVWQDFDGEGFTIKDTITGTVNRDSRIESSSGVVLGRVSIAGVDQIISKIDAKKAPGVELRQGYLELAADARIEKPQDTLPATGWQRDFKSSMTTLHLAPGWRLLGVGGADQVTHSWVKTWNFPTAFLVIFVTFCIYRLMGRGAGIITALGLVLIHPDFSALAWYAVWIIPAIALIKILPEGKLRKFLSFARMLLLAGLVIHSLDFSFERIRQAVYPQLKDFLQNIT